MPTFKGYYKAPLGNWAIFSKGRTGNPTTEGYQVTRSQGLTPVGLMQHSEKTNILRAEALDREGKVWRRQLERKGQGAEEGSKEPGKRDLGHKTTVDRTSSLVAFQTVELFHCPGAPSPLLIHCREGAERDGVRKGTPRV